MAMIPLLISGDVASRWFYREKGSTEHKSIHERAPERIAKWKSMEPQMAAHYKIQNKDQYEPPNKGCLQNIFKKKLPLPGVVSVQNRPCGICSILRFVEKPSETLVAVYELQLFLPRGSSYGMS